jgi:iron complex outermembrane recepter protein
MARLQALSGVAIVALVSAGAPLAAQNADDSATSEAVASDNQILVTARKRSESLQDVPIPISVFDDKALQRMQVFNITDLSLAAPSVLITQTGGSANAAQIFIRGFGRDALGYNAEAPVAVYFDDVFMSRAQGAMLDILDLERVEILRGPQGTLFGRNATAGAVRFVVRGPDLDDVRGRADVTLGNFNRIDVRGSISVPLIEGELAAKLDVVSRNADGYVGGVNANGTRNNLDINGMDRALVRGALAWRASEKVMVDITGDYSRDRSGAITGTPITCQAGANSVCVPRFGDPFLAGINFPGEQRFTGWGLSAKVTADLGFGEFKSISAYRGLSALDPIDLSSIPGAPSPIIYDQDQEQFSQELQLVSSSDGPFNFAAGVFYFYEKWRTDSNFVNLRRNVDEQTAHSIAAFGELYYTIAPGLTITAGGRITYDTKSIARDIFVPRTAAVPTVSTQPADFSETVFTPKLAVDYKASDNVLLYASWAQGYRPGGFGNTWPGNAIAAQGQFAAELAENFEVGAKASAWNGRFTIDFAAYRSEYTDLQQGQLTPTAFIVTSSDARVQGIEIETTLRPVQGLSLFANLGLLDNKITRSNIPGDDLTRRLRYAPEVTFMLGGQYETAIDSKGTRFFIGANYAYVSRTPMDQANSLSLFMPAYGLLDGQVGFEFADQRYRVSLGGRNLTDKAYWRSGVPGQARFYAPPRTILLNLATQF